MRRFRVAAIALFAVAALARSASADDAMWRNFRGRVMFSDIALAPAATFESPAMMTAALKRIERSTFDQTAGFWRIHVMAFLDRPAPASALKLRATDVTDPRAPREVRVFDVPVERDARELRLDDFVVTEDMGFARGATYQISIEAGNEGPGAAEAGKARKADVYAKGVITLR